MQHQATLVGSGDDVCQHQAKPGAIVVSLRIDGGMKLSQLFSVHSAAVVSHSDHGMFGGSGDIDSDM